MKFLIQGVVHLVDRYGKILGFGTFTRISLSVLDDDDVLCDAMNLEASIGAKKWFDDQQALIEIEGAGYMLVSTTIVKL